MRCSRGAERLVAFHATRTSHDDHRFLIFSESSFLRLVPHGSPTTISARSHVGEKSFDTSGRLLRRLAGEIPSKLTMRAKMVTTDDERILRSRSVRIYEVCPVTCPRILFCLNTASSMSGVQGLFQLTQLQFNPALSISRTRIYVRDPSSFGLHPASFETYSQSSCAYTHRASAFITTEIQ